MFSTGVDKFLLIFPQAQKTPGFPGVFLILPVDKPVDNVDNSLSHIFHFVGFLTIMSTIFSAALLFVEGILYAPE